MLANKFDLFEMRQFIKNAKIVLSFEGHVSQGILRNMMEMLQEKLYNTDENDSSDHQYTVIKKVFFIFIELAQNIQKYSYEQDNSNNKKNGAGIIVIREDSDFFSVSSGSISDVNSAEYLKDYCYSINKLSKDEMKDLYKSKLKKPRLDTEQSSGLGLLDIAIKSGSPLNIEVKPIDKEKVFFELTAKVNKEN